MEEPAEYAVRGGVRYRILQVQDTDAIVSLEGEPTSRFPEAVEVGPDRRWVRVPGARLERIVSRRSFVGFRGVEVAVDRLDDDTALISFSGDEQVAEALGMNGDRYLGWTRLVPLADLEDARVEERDVPW